MILKCYNIYMILFRYIIIKGTNIHIYLISTIIHTIICFSKNKLFFSSGNISLSKALLQHIDPFH